MIKTPRTLDELLAPVSVETFLKEAWGKQFTVIHGEARKFDGLFPWERLNQILEEHEFFYPRLRLVKNGSEMNPRDYCALDPARGTSQLKSREVADLLAGGATLVIDGVERTFRPLRDLATHIGWSLRVPLLVNLYASFRTDNGFNLHWDEQDAMILQVSGRKHWRIYAPTRPHPLKHERIETPKPDVPPVWDGLLQEGDLLYMPRGWWHIVFPIDEPSVHLTVTLLNWRGPDLLHWFVESLNDNALARQDLPHLASAEELAAHVNTLRNCLVESWSSDIVERFLRSKEVAIRPRPYFHLPQTVTSAGLAQDRELSFRLAVRRIVLETADGELLVSANSKTWRVPETLRSSLEILTDSSPHRLVDLLGHVGGEANQKELNKLLSELLREGVVEVVEDDASRPEADTTPKKVTKRAPPQTITTFGSKL